MRARIQILLLLIVLLISVSGTQAQPVVVLFAASSTTDAVQSVADSLFLETGITVRINPASSSTLARQIDQGAPADLYLSANELWMDWLEERDGIHLESRINLLQNSLVLVASSRAATFLERYRSTQNLPDVLQGRLAIGDPSHVPAGMYAKQALSAAGWWEELKNRLAPGANVRDALHFIESGEVEAGIVYGTDARFSDNVITVQVLQGHDPILYPLALTRDASQTATIVYEYFTGEKAAQIFEGFGFLSVSGETP